MSFSYEELAEIRHYIHQHPELSGQEYQTTAFLRERLEKLGIRILESGLKTGLIAEIGSGQPVVALRADIDALPILEQTNLPYQSQHPGVMHACGHDIHMTTALGLLDQMLQVQPKNNMLFLFQPAEENEAGGMLMYEDGAFGDWLPDEFYGLHVRPDFKVGAVSYTHLRAHETRHDLVCRLLLEKKKNK